jgi:hypothetical protein
MVLFSSKSTNICKTLFSQHLSSSHGHWVRLKVSERRASCPEKASHHLPKPSTLCPDDFFPVDLESDYFCDQNTDYEPAIDRLRRQKGGPDVVFVRDSCFEIKPDEVINEESLEKAWKFKIPFFNHHHDNQKWYYISPLSASLGTIPPKKGIVATENSSLTRSRVRRFPDARFGIMTTDPDFAILDLKLLGKVNEMNQEETQRHLFLRRIGRRRTATCSCQVACRFEVHGFCPLPGPPPCHSPSLLQALLLFPDIRSSSPQGSFFCAGSRFLCGNANANRSPLSGKL